MDQKAYDELVRKTIELMQPWIDDIKAKHKFPDSVITKALKAMASSGLTSSEELADRFHDTMKETIAASAYRKGEWPGLTEVRLERIDSRWRQLHELEVDSGKEAINFLFLVNSGGAVATLSFIGALDNTTPPVKCALLCFVCGIIAVGFLKAWKCHYLRWLFGEFRADLHKYQSNEMTYDNLLSKDEGRARKEVGMIVVGWLSFLLFLGGCGFGSQGIFSDDTYNKPAIDQPPKQAQTSMSKAA